MSEPLNLESIARRAVSCAKRIAQIWNIEPDDYRDMIQAAQERAMFSARKSNNPAYIFRAAANGALNWWVAWRTGRNSHRREDYQQAPIALTELMEEMIAVRDEYGGEEAKLWIDERYKQVVQFLYGARKKQGARGMKAAERDAQIIWLAASGCSNSQIADHLGMSRDNVSKYRAQIKKTLRAI